MGSEKSIRYQTHFVTVLFHYLVDEWCSTAMTSNSGRSSGIPTSRVFILKSIVGSMNTTHQLSNVVTRGFSMQNGYLLNVPQQIMHTLTIPKMFSSPLPMGVGRIHLHLSNSTSRI